MSTSTSSDLVDRALGSVWYLYVGLVAVFLMLPLFSLVIASFYDGQIFSFPYEFTVDWYVKALQSSSVQSAVATTVTISIPVTILSTIIGTAAAIGYTRHDFGGKGYVKLFALLPIFFPLILLGLGMSMWASMTGLGYGVLPAIIGELVWISPIVMFVVSITALGVDPNMEEAAKDLGADATMLYRDVVLPQISDGVVSGAIFAFVLAWNNYYIVSYLKGSQITITTWIHGRMTQGFTPIVPALASMIFYFSLLLLVAAVVIELRGADIKQNLQNIRD
ncbi:ABC transporter permease [Halorarius litoreus]|uniref:ABC transporter permease n=1 Tax=Halorarius litoreus TaxID=2962676 RepID=UPI0020CCE345|nr:ABC transporter permease [Halorarius litoreus]